ncbi:MAG: glycosyltransferase, partial [Pedobacter sp.]
MHTNKLVSIALCTYNGELYLQEQLNTLVKQTYKNIEIVIADD